MSKAKALANRLTPLQAKEYSLARNRGYLACRGKTVNVENCWWDYCAANRLPYIIFRIGVKFAKMKMDLYTWGRLSEMATSAMFDILAGAHQYRKNGKHLLAIGAVCSMAVIRLEDVDMVARCLLDVIEEFGEKRP